MSWRSKATKVIEFKDGFLEGISIKMLRPSALTLEELEALPSAKAREDFEQVRAEEIAPFLKMLILEWNLRDPVTDDILPLPKDSPDVVKKIPVMVLNEINKVIAEEGLAVPPPKET